MSKWNSTPAGETANTCRRFWTTSGPKVSREGQIKAGNWDKKQSEKYLLCLCAKN
jgi:hypothetical protein